MREHLARHGARAKVHITGHSLGGGLAVLVALMLILRGGAPRAALADVWTFGAPYVLCGGDALLARLGQGLTLVHCAAQPEPFMTHNTP